MEIPIRRFDTNVPLPEYKTPGAVAMDCTVRESVIIAPQSIGYAFLNFALKPPAGHFVMLAPRSSLHKRGLTFANGVGIFDEDYCGDEDEYKAILFNFTNEPVEVAKGDRIAQIVFIPYTKVTLAEQDALDNPSRGGLGTTG
jgi:dUTP pyrophosphatase